MHPLRIPPHPPVATGFRKQLGAVALPITVLAAALSIPAHAPAQNTPRSETPAAPVENTPNSPQDPSQPPPRPPVARPEAFAAFPKTRTPFPGGDLFRAPDTPALWKVSLQKTATSGADPSPRASRSFQRAEIFRGPDPTRVKIFMGAGDPLEKWRVGSEHFRYSAPDNLALRDGPPPITEDSLSAETFSAETVAWAEMQELAWISKENFWFRLETPTGALFLFVEEDAPEAENPPTGLAEATNTLRLSSSPNTALAEERPASSPAAQRAAGAPEKNSLPTTALETDAGGAPEKKRAAGPLPEPEADIPYGQIPGIQLKPSIRAAAIDAKTRLPRVVQIAGMTFVYTFETKAETPEIPGVIKNLVGKSTPRPPVDPSVPSVPVP